MKSASVLGLISVVGSVLLTGCASLIDNELEASTQKPFERLRAPQRQAQEREYRVDDFKTQFERGPGVHISKNTADVRSQRLQLELEGEPLAGNYNMPLPAFINEVFGEQLGLSFSLEPQIKKQADMVTLRLNDAVEPSDLFRIAVDTLNRYGVAVQQQGELLAFSIDKSITAGDTPLLVSGRTLPDVPQSHRPVFMFVQLSAVTNTKVRGWVADALKGKDIVIKEDPVRNAILLQGKPDLVRQALAIIDVLDQPLMRGRFSLSIEPAFTKVAALAKDLEVVLHAEGYDASIRPPLGAIMLIPLKASNQLVVFAQTEQILAHVSDWVKRLDRRQQLSIDSGVFIYSVKNTDAAHVLELLKELDAGGNGSSDVGGSSVSRFVVDKNRNAIIFKGSGQQWLELLPVIKEIDQVAPSVLVEVLLAEITLSDDEQTGFEFLAKGSLSINGKDYATTMSTIGGLGVGSSGLSATLGSAGETRAILNVFYESKRAEIRSRPRLMVKSGEEAVIDVGTEVPVITSNSQSADGGDSPVIQSVQYRKTGVRLNIKPVVHASGRVDIAIEQELSEAQPNGSSGIDSPSIFNRKISTVVTLQDGGSILLGGLISSSKTNNKNGVVGLASIPLIGRFFKSTGDSGTRTELIVMVIPYVINSHRQGQDISARVAESLLGVER